MRIHHHVWFMAMTATLSLFGSQPTQAQGPMQPYSAVSRSSGVVQAGFHEDACGACGGGGCAICGLPPTAGGFHLANHLGAHHAGGCDDSCGCGPGMMGAGMGGAGMMGPGMMGAGMMGAGMGGGLLAAEVQKLQALNAAQGGGFSTQLLGQENGPFGNGGCCTPMWYDVHAEWMYLKRDSAGDSIDFTSRNAGGPPALSTSDLGFGNESGFRATYALLVGPSTNLEASYFGTHHWSSSATVTGNGNLFSIFSNYGTVFFPNPPNAPVQGFPQTVDAAIRHSIDYSSEIHNGELNLRHRWTSASCLLHGSYLMGARYVTLNEDFGHDTLVANGGFLNYDVRTDNDAVGFQLGTDMYVCITPRFKLGAEIEAGIYGNRAQAASQIRTRDNNGQLPVERTIVDESISGTSAAFVGELGAIGVFKITPRLSVRGGYQMIFLDGFALASENFNTTSPFGDVTRTTFLDDNGDVFLHGSTLGFEWTW